MSHYGSFEVDDHEEAECSTVAEQNSRRRVATTAAGLLLLMVCTGCVMFEVGQWSAPVSADVAETDDVDAVAQRVVLIDSAHSDHENNRHHRRRRRAAENKAHRERAHTADSVGDVAAPVTAPVKGSVDNRYEDLSTSSEQALERAAVQDFGVANFATVQAEQTFVEYNVDVADGGKDAGTDKSAAVAPSEPTATQASQPNWITVAGRCRVSAEGRRPTTGQDDVITLPTYNLLVGLEETGEECSTACWKHPHCDAYGIDSNWVPGRCVYYSGGPYYGDTSLSGTGSCLIKPSAALPSLLAAPADTPVPAASEVAQPTATEVVEEPVAEEPVPTEVAQPAAPEPMPSWAAADSGDDNMPPLVPVVDLSNPVSALRPLEDNTKEEVRADIDSLAVAPA